MYCPHARQLPMLWCLQQIVIIRKLASRLENRNGEEIMRTVKDWRSARTVEDFAGLDYADFAQEFLRRNPKYCREYYELEGRIDVNGLDRQAEMENLAQRWGLSFPVRPRPCARRGPGNLGAEPDDHHGRPRRRSR